MKKRKEEKSGEVLQKKYATLIKKIPTEDLRDMLSILLCDPKLAAANLAMGQLDIEKLDRQDQKYHLNTSAKLRSFDTTRYEELYSRLDKKFHIFDKEKYLDPIFEKKVEVFPKVSLLIETIKSTLSLRETGKELPDDQRIVLIECFTSDHSDKDYTIVINEDYEHPLEVRKSTKIWGMFFDLVENGYIDKDETTVALYDYLNFNPYNRITTNTKYPLQMIIKQNDNSYKPSFKTSIQTDKALAQRQNKLKSST